MSDMEKFDPSDPKYKKVEDLPEDQKKNYTNFDGGFIRASWQEYLERIKGKLVPNVDEAGASAYERFQADIHRHLRDIVRERGVEITDADLSGLVDFSSRLVNLDEPDNFQQHGFVETIEDGIVKKLTNKVTGETIYRGEDRDLSVAEGEDLFKRYPSELTSALEEARQRSWTDHDAKLKAKDQTE